MSSNTGPDIISDGTATIDPVPKPAAAEVPRTVVGWDEHL